MSLVSTRCSRQVARMVCGNRSLQRLPVRQASGTLHEPDYINVKPEIPVYDTLNVRLRGYDFPVLESFAKYVHKTADTLNLDATAFAVPARSSHIQSYKPQSTHILNQYHLNMYERVIQVDDLNSTTAPIFIQLLQCNMPAGVQMTIKPVDSEEDSFRYVPDLTLIELQTQVADLDKVKDDRKRK